MKATVSWGVIAVLVSVYGAAAWGEAERASASDGFYRLRGGIDNCRMRFLNDKEGRVAYIGGSITTMKGWRELTYDLFKTRFPDTEFDFINAGIGGTNSTLGAFRFEDHVFKNGPVDLLFLEFAVNDGGTETPGNRSRRAMEGIIRHARRLNPHIDIIMQYFADRGKVAAINAGKIPESIAHHEEVAAHYDVPVIDLAREMTRRLNDGQFTWEQFSRDSCHPLPFGHQQYAACIDAFLAAAWAGPPAPETTPHAMPAPLDPLNYENGRFIALEAARVRRGWTRDPAWDAEKKCNYGGAVDVLAAETPGAVLELEFKGSLIGISAIAGMDAGILECRVDGGEVRTVDLFDHYCKRFHRPVCHVLAEALPPGQHVLELRMADDNNEASTGHAARILEFVAN